MCLAIPARILSVTGATASLDMGGNRISADISLVPGVGPGDYVMVHAGIAIQKYDEAEALATLELFRAYAAGLEEEQK